MTLTILCYLSNDFDLINHGKVIMNLEFYGIQGPSDVERQPEKYNIKCGVQHGAILGPVHY